jgi:hypothetical protein
VHVAQFIAFFRRMAGISGNLTFLGRWVGRIFLLQHQSLVFFQMTYDALMKHETQNTGYWMNLAVSK